MEVGFFVSTGNPLGETIPIAEAEEHIFGICLVNDWSARDIQAWEYQPLGPFWQRVLRLHSRHGWSLWKRWLRFARLLLRARQATRRRCLIFFDRSDQEHGGLDLWLEVSLLSAPHARNRHRSGGFEPKQFSRHVLDHGADADPSREQWLQSAPGDLLASGTVSGADKTARGCLLELTTRGQDPVTLPTGEQRKFLEDGDEVILRGFAEREGFRRIGLGSCRGTILPASAT